MAPQPLPANNFTEGKQRDAYERVLYWEHASAQDPDKMMRARVLGYLMHEAPTADGKDHMADEINDCDSENELIDLSIIYIKHFIRCCETTTPAVAECGC